ncbi:MAG: glycosyltransferase family protein [Nitrospinota bacterium]|nr:glycosyltransferase family protein [Nitrospinota bacterium]
MSPNSNNSVVIIQARIGSERLPGKSLLDICGKPLIERVIESAREIKSVKVLVLATTWLAEDDPLAEAGKTLGCEVFRGDPEDVLARYHNAAQNYKADTIVRLCGDSPIIDTEYMDRMVIEHLEKGADLTCNISPLPLGPTGSVVSRKALEIMFQKADTGYQREHVTPYISEHRKEFNILEMTVPVQFHRNYRMTIDETADLEMFKKLYHAFETEGFEPNYSNAIHLLDNNSDMSGINRSVPQRDWRR